ncbi:MAG: EmrB/QacA family drug resistance transporter [Actinobacteria bacterium 69-20]|jgi:EmrB/QacA subfamily drug resistance transporter|nr:DHA2 family efflux MFS transporter permease subunit [Actinomycetota bacterium]OJV29525.1 MAG: EmrB/QacA family drug resistance transporter [Actinobacteria bacterium 69-20]
MTETLERTGAEPPAATGPMKLPHRRVLVILIALILGMMLAALDQTVVATALPTIVGKLGGAQHISWIITAYILASTVSTPLWGKLGDLYGRKTFFQVSIVIFLIGSAMSGAATSMTWLIISRAFQGLGGGGLIVGSQAIVGDVVSPRDRGKYQGLFGAVFAVTTVIGPLIGGFLTEHASWRWVFYVNLPIGAVALVACAIVLPGNLTRVKHAIDYAGTVLLALGVTALVLLTSLGGTSYPWDSWQTYVFGACAVVFLLAWALVERRASEPILPLRLFKNRVFAATSAIGFVVGFGMFGAITYLPVFLQVAKGASPTGSGLQLIPVMAGVLVTSVGTGFLITRWGRYKIFPVLGTAVMTLGLYLLSTVGANTPNGRMYLYMVIFGIGLGGVMQVLVIAVQNAVKYTDLGVATAGATFFRSIGGSFGTAVFGAIFANVLGGRLASALHGVAVPPGLEGSVDPTALAALPAPVRDGIIDAYSSTIGTVFLWATPVAAVAFLLTWLLPEIRLRHTIGDNTADTVVARSEATASIASRSDTASGASRSDTASIASKSDTANTSDTPSDTPGLVAVDAGAQDANSVISPQSGGTPTDGEDTHRTAGRHRQG